MRLTDFKFECEIQPAINGFSIRGVKPDSDGFYTIPIGAIGIPTRGGIMYEPKSMINCMRDENSRFQICLRDGNLAGEIDHPVIRSKSEMWRLFAIDNKCVSHYFKKIYTAEPINIEGMECVPIIGVLKPSGPYGKSLKDQLDDESHNTAFSMRTVCLPIEGPASSKYSWREVQEIITFDAVFAPGYANTSKRYAPGTASFSMDLTQKDLQELITDFHYGGVASDDSFKSSLQRLLDKGKTSYSINNKQIKGVLSESGIQANGISRDYGALRYEQS